MNGSYQMNVKVGDIVLLPNGIVGIVTFWDITMGGNCKEVFVHPFTNWIYYSLLFIFGRLWFCDREINKLKPIHREA
jgi:hypothetical protein